MQGTTEATKARRRYRSLRTKADRSFGTTRTRLLFKALDAAKDSGKDQLVGRAKIDLTQDLRDLGSAPKLELEHVRWLGAQLDAEAAWITWWDELRILWLNRQLTGDLIRHPEIPLSAIVKELKNLQRRLQKAGKSAAAAYQAAYELDAHLHGHLAAHPAFLRWQDEPRDEVSARPSDEAMLRMEHYREIGDYEAVLNQFDRYLPGHYPDDANNIAAHDAITEAALVQQVPGLAVGSHLRCTSALTFDWLIAEHLPELHRPETAALLTGALRICVRSGTVERGLELLRRHYTVWTEPDTDPLTELQLHIATHAVLQACAELGMETHRLVPLGGPPGVIGLLAEQELRLARNLATKFDNRNRTTTQSDSIDQLLRDPVVPPLPLTGYRDGEPSGFLAMRANPRNEHPFAPRTDNLDRLDPVQLMALADEVYRWGGEANLQDIANNWRARRDDELLCHAQSLLDGDGAEQDSLPILEPGAVIPRTRERAMVDLDYLCVWSARPPADDTEYQLAQLAQRYRDLGEEADALICEQRIAIDAGDEERAVSIVADVDAVGNREQKLRIRAKLFSVGGDFDAVEMASETRTMIAEGGPLNANERALAAILLANGAEDAETMLPVLDEALNLLLPGEWPEFRALLLSNRGMARLRFGQPEAGQADLLAAEHTAADAGELNALAVVLEQRARFVWDTDMAGGERNMLRARWAAIQAENTESLTASGGMLTELLFDTGKYFEAAEYLYDTLAELDDDDLPESPRRRNVALRLRSQLERIGAKVLRACEDQLDTEDDGLGSETMLRSAIDDMEAAGDLEELASAHFELGELLTETDALEALHEYDLAADLARDAGDTRLSMVIARERVHAVMTADGPDAALAALESCAAMNEKLWLDTLTDPDLRDSLNWDFDTEELRLTEMRIRVLRTANRSGEALGLIDKLANSFHVREQAGSATRLRILHADLLMDVGNRESALDEFRGAAADAMADNDPDLARFAAFRGAERLRESGEPDAAMAFWQSLNPDDDE